MSTQGMFKNVQEALEPKIYPVGYVLKFDPPVIGLLYKRNPKEKKKRLYQIHLNNLIFLTNGEDITRQIFYEHPHYLNPESVKPDQILNLVMKLLEYKNQRLREMAEFMEEQGGENQEEQEENEENMEDFEQLSEEQLYQLYQQQMEKQNKNDLNNSF